MHPRTCLGCVWKGGTIGIFGAGVRTSQGTHNLSSETVYATSHQSRLSIVRDPHDLPRGTPESLPKQWIGVRLALRGKYPSLGAERKQDT